jgi:hypothetical protein
MSTAHPRYHPDCSPTQGTPLGARKGDDPLVQASVACAPVTEGVPARPTGKSRNHPVCLMGSRDYAITFGGQLGKDVRKRFATRSHYPRAP